MVTQQISRLLCATFLAFPLVASAGLDLSVYEKLTAVRSPRVGSDGEPLEKNQVKLAPVGYPERFEGLRSGAVYQYQSAFEFRAGSYTGYADWRNELAKLAGYKQTPYRWFDGQTVLRYDATVWQQQSGPFWELIAFSDAEGVIGPVVCKRVYRDFVTFQTAASQHPDADFRSAYADWTKAFAMCAHGGAIVFH